MLADRSSWALEDSQNLWACGPADGCGANIFVRGRRLRQGLHAVRHAALLLLLLEEAGFL